MYIMRDLRASGEVSSNFICGITCDDSVNPIVNIALK
jgi:hypothetical protein